MTWMHCFAIVVHGAVQIVGGREEYSLEKFDHSGYWMRKRLGGDKLKFSYK